jgi:hypothetical protein
MIRKLTTATLAGAFILFTSRTASGQSAQQPTIDAPLETANARARIPDFSPGLDDLMTMLVQPRHIRLYYSGIRNNWELAAFELGELRAAFQRVSQSIPTYLDNDVQAALQTLIEPKMQAVAAAIRTGNQKQFATSYADLTAACNACHTFLEHPFLVIKVPDTPNNADQAFGK